MGDGKRPSRAKLSVTLLIGETKAQDKVTDHQRETDAKLLSALAWAIGLISFLQQAWRQMMWQKT